MYRPPPFFRKPKAFILEPIVKVPDLKKLWPEFQKTPAFSKLNEGQKQFFEAFFNKGNVFLTGSAGTGKSYCVRELFNFLESKGFFVSKTALTGVAALNLGGATLHSFSGIGLGQEDIDFLKKKVRGSKKACERILNTSILFIDEISMAGAELLEKVNEVFKHIRGSQEPFGGMKIVASGDFLQLLPVFRGQEDKRLAFESDFWKEAGFEVCYLKKLVRQDETTPFAKLLQEIRYGEVEGIEILNSRINAKLWEERPIKIFCKNIDIDKFNREQYMTINAEKKRFFATDTGAPHYSEYFDKNCAAPKELSLKVRCQVMLLHNLSVEDGLVNGSIGEVKDILSIGVLVKFRNGETAIVEKHTWELKEQAKRTSGQNYYKTIATRTQVPLKLAWATSVHKSQGATLDCAEVDVSGSFCEGQVYTALSRLKTLEGLSLVEFDIDKIRANPKCVAFYKNLK